MGSMIKISSISSKRQTVTSYKDHVSRIVTSSNYFGNLNQRFFFHFLTYRSSIYHQRKKMSIKKQIMLY